MIKSDNFKFYKESLNYILKVQMSDGSISWEKDKKLDNIQSCINFKKSCENSKKRVTDHLKKLKNKGKKICGYAAASKSTTILNYCNLDHGIINFTVIKQGHSFGRST